MNRIVPLVSIVLLIGGCGAPEPLPPKPAEVPVGVDLSGEWLLRDDSAESTQAISEAARRAAGEEASLLSRSSNNRSRSADYHVHVFLESGSRLKVTQTEFALFVSFDRSVVEEYRFGEQRRVNVGPVVAERVSGWEQGGYVIETRDEDRAMLIESYRLEDADTMIRTIRIIYREDTELDLVQLFDRV